MDRAHPDAAMDAASDRAMELLAARAPGATICPSEVARALTSAGDAGTATSDWRDAMPVVHAAIDRMLVQGTVRLSWKGQPLAARAGPYRIGRVADR